MTQLARGTEPLPSGLLIGDRWVHQSDGGTMDHVNPATGRVQATFPVASAGEVAAAVEAAGRGLAVFRTWSADQRRDGMLRLASLVRANADELARLGTLESGLTVPIANNTPLVAAQWLDYYAGWADKINGETVSGASGFDYTIAEPCGVVAMVLTWNAALGSLGMKIAAALATGCSVVLKPPELAPFTTSVFARLCLEAGFPAGVVNVVPGGPEAGEALVRHPLVDKVSFTGSPLTATRIQAACAETLTPLLLELGGKSANIVFGDADLDRAVTVASEGVIALSGQVCVAPTRLLVQESVHDEVVDRVSARFESVRIGDPFDPSTEMGPVISGKSRDRIVSMVDSARRSSSGRHVVGGSAVQREGFYVSPAVFADVDPSSRLAQEEVFGPVLTVMRFKGEDDAIRLANGNQFGLAAYLHTTDLSTAHRVASRLDAGNVAVNGGLPMAGPHAPFGGFKGSGYGKEGGLAGLLEFVRIKNVNIAL